MRRAIFRACILVSLVTLAVGAGGFSSAQTDRSLTIDAVGDGDAYMALDYAEHRVDRDAAVGETVTLPVVTVTNQFTEDVSVSVDYTVAGTDGFSAGTGRDAEHLDVGASTEVSTTVHCAPSGHHTVTVEFGVTADGNDVFAETGAERTVTYAVHCDGWGGATPAR